MSRIEPNVTSKGGLGWNDLADSLTEKYSHTPPLNHHQENNIYLRNQTGQIFETYSLKTKSNGMHFVVLPKPCLFWFATEAQLILLQFRLKLTECAENLLTVLILRQSCQSCIVHSVDMIIPAIRKHKLHKQTRVHPQCVTLNVKLGTKNKNSNLIISLMFCLVFRLILGLTISMIRTFLTLVTIRISDTSYHLTYIHNEFLQYFAHQHKLDHICIDSSDSEMFERVTILLLLL